MRSAGIPCDRCHVREAERYVVYRQNVAWLVGHTTSTTAGGLCAACRGEVFVRSTLTSLAFGWWSPRSLFLNPVVILGNVVNHTVGSGADPEWTERRNHWDALQRIAPDEEASLAEAEVVQTPAPAPPPARPRRDDAPAAARTDLLATASFFGDIVEETFVQRGGTLQIGHSDAMGVPVPEGWPFLARIHWAGRRRVIVEDHEGREHALEPGEHVILEAGPVTLDLHLVARYPLRRTEDVQWWGSMAWFAVVFAATLVSMQGAILAEHACDWFGLMCPPVQVASGTGGAVTAEYLARLLREDYAGSDDGAIELEEREKGERENPSFYLPAGAEGPVTAMGGAEQQAAEEIRTPQPEDVEDPAPPTAGDDFQLVADEGVGTPLPAVEDDTDPEDVEDAVADGEGVEDTEKTEAPAEDKEGWGVQDWYDADDKRLEQLEIELMLRAARERMKIDPNDPDALSVLSYYQYLAEDYDAAARTYDKFISLYPEESAGYNNKALIYKRLGQFEKEEGLYRVALALRPDDETALNNLAVCLSHQGRHNEALAIMKRLETIDPGDPYADLHRAKIHAEMGDDEQAYAYLEKALQGMADLDTLHHIEFRQDIRLDPSFEKLRQTRRFHAILTRYYGTDSPLQEGG